MPREISLRFCGSELPALPHPALIAALRPSGGRNAAFLPARNPEKAKRRVGALTVGWASPTETARGRAQVPPESRRRLFSKHASVARSWWAMPTLRRQAHKLRASVVGARLPVPLPPGGSTTGRPEGRNSPGFGRRTQLGSAALIRRLPDGVVSTRRVRKMWWITAITSSSERA